MPIRELIKQPRLPLQRTYRTWNKWFEAGIRINGALKQLPQIYIEGVRHSSVEAIVDFFNQLDREPPPDTPKRKRREKHG